MTEEEARERIVSSFGARASDRLGAFLTQVVAENEAQNLIAPSTIGSIWSRHALDSAQLVPMGKDGRWIDIGTGGGFPGIVIAILRDQPMTLVEPRRRRATFLEQCVQRLDLSHVTVVAGKVENVAQLAQTISARAVASIEKILQMAAHCAMKETRWLLPRGRLADADLVDVQRHWRGVFHVEQSLTDPASSILVIDEVIAR